MSARRVALVHHWLVTTRGGERTFEAIAELFPSADIFTLVCDRSAIPASLKERTIRTSLLQRFPGATRRYPYYLPLFPFVTGRLDLRDYDLIVSSDAATVKGVQAGEATHVCYCHTPMRYAWYGDELHHQTPGPVSRLALQVIRGSLCRWDYEAAQRVTHFVANSHNVQKRILECYGRESAVIYPPVDTERFRVSRQNDPAEDYFLVVSQLVPYKRVDLLVDAFTRCRKPLRIIGEGPERRRLEVRAGPNIQFLGSQPDAAVVQAMQRCRAFVFAGEEDFGIVMAEAQCCGTPVIALGRGGALEIVEQDVTGILFQEQSVDSVIEALEQFDAQEFDPIAARRSALRFSRERFLLEFCEFVACSTI